jgi:hypothetical protein
MTKRLAIILAATMTATVAATAAGAPAQAQVRDMTLAEKVGQMIVSYVYGDNATAPSAADAAANQAMFGADVTTGAQAVAKYHLGGVIYFTWSHNLTAPTQIAALSNGLQHAAMADTGVPLQISTDQRAASSTASAPRSRSRRATWRWARPSTRAPPSAPRESAARSSKPSASTSSTPRLWTSTPTR